MADNLPQAVNYSVIHETKPAGAPTMHLRLRKNLGVRSLDDLTGSLHHQEGEAR